MLRRPIESAEKGVDLFGDIEHAAPDGVSPGEWHHLPLPDVVGGDKFARTGPAISSSQSGCLKARPDPRPVTGSRPTTCSRSKPSRAHSRASERLDKGDRLGARPVAPLATRACTQWPSRNSIEGRAIIGGLWEKAGGLGAPRDGEWRTTAP